MALSILTNPVAIGTQGSVNNANNALAKTIKQLSSGLRINSAADDASGLAVSEKLRGQISGLKVAARNAQDGISFLQTAEAAMGTMTSMVQRVRELAVQAGDPAYTDGDRVMLQTEVDQLKEEINRVSSSAEFNTKKLLNGDSAALWSATGGIDAIVRGATVEGNYKIASTLTPGTNNVYKTQAMNVGNGKQSFTMTTAGSGVTRLDNITGTLAGQAFAINATITTAAATGARVTTTFNATGDFLNVNSFTGLTTALAGGEAADFEFRVVKNISTTAAGTTIAGALEFRVKNLDNGKMSEWTTLDVNTTAAGSFRIDSAIVSNRGRFSAAFTSVGLTAGTLGGAGRSVTTSSIATGATAVVQTVGSAALTYSAAQTAKLISQTSTMIGQLSAFATVTSTGTNGGSFTVEFEAMSAKTATSGADMRYRVVNASTGALSGWYNFSVNATGETSATSGYEAMRSVGLTGVLFTSGSTIMSAGSFNVGTKALISGGEQTFSTTRILTGSNSAFVQLGANGPMVYFSALSTTGADKTVRLFSAQMDSAGKAYYGSMDATFALGTTFTAGSTTAASVNFIKSGDAASSTTRLSDLSNFTNADGVNVLDNTQTLTIYGNGRQTNITLDKADTIKTFEDKMRAAIVDGLGMGSDSASDVNANLVKFMSSDVVTPNGDRAVPGTFIFQGAKLGANSEISFSGNQNVINALGVANIQEATISQLQVNVSNAHDGTFVGATTTSDGVARGLIRNVDLKLDMAAGANATWDATANKLVFTPNAGTESFLHLKNNATVAAIGANEGQTLDISIGRMDTTSLGIDDVSVLTLGAAQKSISKLDLALDEINKSRAVVGAQMNRLDYTINNLNVTRENMMSAESRIRDLDMAEAATNLTAQQVRLQAATAMLAQANQLPTYAAQLLR